VAEERERSVDSAIDILAYAALVGAGGYAGLKYFPSISLKRAAARLAPHIEQHGGQLRGLLGNINKVFGRSTVQPPGWKHGRAGDLTLLHELETAMSVLRSDSRISGASVDDVTRSLISRYSSDVPQAFGSMTPLTVRDFLAEGAGFSRLSAAVGAESARKLRDSLRELGRIPGFRQSLSRLGLTPTQFFGRVPVGAFMMKGPEGVLNIRSGARALFEDIASVKIPFTEFKPFSLLIPDLSPKPGMTFLGPTASKGMFGAEDALFIKGSVYPLRRQQGQLLMDRPEVGYRLASARQEGVARAVAARMGVLKPVTYSEESLGERVARARRLPEWRRKALRLQRRFGLGPEWAGRRSIAEVLYSRFRALATGARAEFPLSAGTPAGIGPQDALLGSGRPVRSIQDLGYGERLRLALGGNVERSFTEEGKTIRRTVARLQGVKPWRKPLPLALGRARMGPGAGEPTQFYAYKGRTAMKDWLNYQVNRPLWLLTEMTGLGMKPGRGPIESLGQIGLKLALPTYLGFEALKYAEYKSSRWLGYGPLTGPAYLYTQARIGTQSVLDAAGVSDMAREAEERYPGSVDSPASKGMRAAASVLAGTLAARRLSHPYAKQAAMAGGMILGALQVAGISQPADELTRVYSGEQDVPVRSGRWWFLGRTPFGGGKIKYWQPHWYQRLKSGYQDVGLYGSEQEAWRKSWLPTPENWFLLKNVYDPYYLERAHWYDRPYPESGGMFGNVPFVGPIAERTVGRAFKPVQRREIPVSASGRGIPGPEQALGLAYGPSQNMETSQTARLDIMTGETIYRLFDWTGLPGFMVGALREQLTGTTGWYLDQKAIATSSAMTSAQRDYYDRNLGGLFGLTEFVRRFVPSEQNYYKVNPLQNRMPNWLPGRRSVFSADRENYIDFHSGDAFTKLEKGEMRLPGPGWQAAHGVNSITPGMYSALDRFQILADVAPNSQAFKHYRRMVEGQVHAGLLARQDVDRFTRIQDQVAEQQRSRVGAGGYRYGSDAFREQEVTIASTGLTSFTTEEHPGMRFHLAGVETRPYALEGAADTYGKLKRRLAEYRGKTVSVTYGGFGVTTPAILGDANRWAIEAGLGKARPVDDLDYRAKHGTSFLQRNYEWLTHTTLPGPLGYPRTKWFGNLSPIEEYESFVRSGTWDTGWEQPVQNYIKPWFNQILGSVSGEQLRARHINEYVDNLKFVKYRRLEDQAAAMGDAQAMNLFHKRASQTLTGIDPRSPDFYSNIFKALPPTERPYFAAFAGVTSEARQERILGAVPENMAPIYMGVWQRQAGTDGFKSPVLRRYAEDLQNRFEERPEDRVAEWAAHHPLPSMDYAGWHPAVDEDDIRIKIANQEALDVHALGMWESQQIEAAEVPVEAPTAVEPMSIQQLQEILRRHGYENVMVMHGFQGDRDQFNFQVPRSRRWNNVNRQYREQSVV